MSVTIDTYMRWRGLTVDTLTPLHVLSVVCGGDGGWAIRPDSTNSTPDARYWHAVRGDTTVIIFRHHPYWTVTVLDGVEPTLCDAWQVEDMRDVRVMCHELSQIFNTL